MKIQTSAKPKAFSLRIITLLFTIVILSQTGNAQDRKIVNLLEKGDEIPVFNYTNDQGKTFTSSDLAGKILVINFFATWCGPCLKELPHVQKEIWEVFRHDPNFHLLVIGREHSIDEIFKFKTENAYSFPMVADTDRSIFKLFASQNIPRTYLIDGQGIIIELLEGYHEEDFRNFVLKIKTLLQAE